MELSTEDKSRLAAEFIEQAPPGEVNDVINDIRAVVASDEALMPHVLPRLRAYNLAQLHTVEHESSTSLISTAAILNGSDERYVDPRAKKSFAFDHVTLNASSYNEYVLPEEFESVRATLDKSLQAYTRDHFATGVCAVFCSANHVQAQSVGEGEEVAADDGKPDKQIGDQEVQEALDDVVDDKQPDQHPADKEIGDSEVQEALDGVVQADEAEGKVADQPGANAPNASDEYDNSKLSDAEASDAEPTEKPAADPAKASEEAVPVVAEPHEHAIVTDESATCEPKDGEAKGEADQAQAQTLPEVANPVYTLQIVGNRYNPQNFWTGRWRSTWTVDPERVTGTIHVDVHYYEQGNVQLATSHAATFDYTDVAKVVDTVAKLEAEYQLGLNDTYNALGDKAFKSLRRALPVTRQKVEWEKISGYKLGADLRA